MDDMQNNPTDEDFRAVGNAAGMAWLNENDPKRMTLSWADVPDEVFARAAIEAMREPSSEMLSSGDAALQRCDLGWEANAAYRAMIEAALSPSPSSHKDE